MKIIITLFAFIASFSISAQTISEGIGGVTCNFEIYSDTTKLAVTKQLLIQRAKARTEKSEYENESYGFAYAYAPWHLEFVTTTQISSRRRTQDETYSRGKYQVIFRDSVNAELILMYLTNVNITLWTGKGESGNVYTYSLNLVNLPLIILDETAKIEIIYIE